MNPKPCFRPDVSRSNVTLKVKKPSKDKKKKKDESDSDEVGAWNFGF